MSKSTWPWQRNACWIWTFTRVVEWIPWVPNIMFFGWKWPFDESFHKSKELVQTFRYQGLWCGDCYNPLKRTLLTLYIIKWWSEVSGLTLSFVIWLQENRYLIFQHSLVQLYKLCQNLWCVKRDFIIYHHIAYYLDLGKLL